MGTERKKKHFKFTDSQNDINYPRAIGIWLFYVLMFQNEKNNSTSITVA